MSSSKSTPLAHAGCLSRLFLCWLSPLLQLGKKQRLEESDLYSVLQEDRSETLGKELQSFWDREVRKSMKQLCEPSLNKVLFQCYGTAFAKAGLFVFSLEAIKVAQPLLLGKIILFFENYDSSDERSLWLAYIYAAALSLSAFGITFLQHLYYYHTQRIGMKMRVAVCHMIFKKALRLSTESVGRTTTGQIVNMLSNDVNRFDEVTLNIHYLWIGPLQAVVILALLWYEIGLSCLAGVTILVLMLPVQTWFGKLFGLFRSKSVIFTDNRIRIMNEVVSGIRIIKMYAWEKPFSTLLTNVRKKEIEQIMKSSYLRGLNMASFFASSKIIVFFTFTVYALLGNAITASTVFVTVSLYGTIKLTVTLFFPLAVEKVSETRVSIFRIRNYLLLDEVEKNNVVLSLEDKDIPVELNDVTCYWDKSLDSPSLQNVSITVKPQQLLAVIGPVGAGKSSLLSAILGELPRDSGLLTVRGQLTYASQMPWVFPGTIRSNILFGKELNPQKYERVIKACALKRDMELLPDGDLTLIGDRGATLSGGQKARVNLARTVYQDADIYLLDDPLSAVDAEVGKYLFDHCIRGLLKNKCCILITHQLQYLKGADHIIVLKEVETVHIISEETRVEGNVSGEIYKRYFTAGCSYVVLLAIVLLSIVAEAAYILQDWWLVYWANDQSLNVTLEIIRNIHNETASPLDSNLPFYLSVYSVRSSQSLHNSMFSAVLRCPVRFFDINPIGRILNRFSKDIGQMDSVLPITFEDFYQLFLQNVGVIVVAASVIPLILVPVVFLLLLFLYLRRFYLQTSRDIKRLEATTRSPVFSHLSSSLQGLWTIRAFSATDRLQQQFDSYQDVHSGSWFLFLMTSRWFALRLDGICSIFITLTAFSCLLLRNGLHAGEVGLVLTYAVTLVGNFQWTVRQSAEVENMMTSVERVVEYTELDSEAPWETQKKPPPDWPRQGMVTFDKVNLRYSDDGPFVLTDLSFILQPGEKVGVVGRTGAGKSSLVSALFRLSEPKGNIYIDGVLTSELGLHDLRQKMSIIPQDPVLFSDTVRKNLDPFCQHTDGDLWNALEEVQLKFAVEELPGRLETVLAEFGSNFSVGQRQLVCLARAVLMKNRILVIDEATANVDPRTDELIQRTIRKKFKDCTVVTIAHRLNTVIDSDRILVLDNGVIQEFDHPLTLLQHPESVFFKMVQQLGVAEAAMLLETARQAHS
ncbi:hypothetical protein WMY93_022567 [Mugilogobius chulae]|uniref:Multidrug resistance-associated protein 4 n=1 Tax=Mugilogobius chulae TaxID=88201 RepID=A0AAW0N7B8_9GOBI